MAYVDGFVLNVPKKNLAAYKKLATKAGKIWREHGALDYKECIGEDLETAKKWKMRTFTGLAKPKEGEVVVFSYILYKSRAQRDKVNAKVMNDPRMKDCAASSIFDHKRMAWGGFDVLVSV